MGFKNLTDAIVNATNGVWGSTVVYTYFAGGAVSTVKGVFSNDFTVIDDVISRSPSVKIKLSDLTADPIEGDTLVIDSVPYFVRESHPDSFGCATLILGKQ